MSRFLHFLTFFTKPLVVLHLVLLSQLGLFIGTTLHPHSIDVPGRTYVYLRGHLVYTSLIRQSKDGAWSLIIPHTTRPTPSVYGHLFFVFLGKIAALLNIEPPIMYMASRIVAGILLFWCTYWFIRIVLPPRAHALGILFILALEPGPLLSTLSWNPVDWKAAIFSYYPQIVAYRHFGLPHHTMGEALGVLLLGVFMHCVQKPTPKRLLLLGTLGLIGTTVLPPYFVILGLCVFIPWSIYTLLTGSFKKIFIPLCITAVAIGAVGIFMKHEFAKGYPWRDFNLDEKRWVTNGDTLINYASTLLLYVPFITFLWIATSAQWKKWEPETRRIVLLMTSWTLMPVALVPISSHPWFPLANFRLMDGYSYVPAGILATLGFTTLIRQIKNRWAASFIAGILTSSVIIISLFLTYTYTKQTLNDQKFVWPNVWLADDHYKAFAFLNTVPKGSGIMIMNHFGEIVPEFAPVRSFIGSTPGDISWGERHRIAVSFFQGTLTNEQARTILEKEDISYVYFGDLEKTISKTPSLYPDILMPVFETPVVTIYKPN